MDPHPASRASKDAGYAVEPATLGTGTNLEDCWRAAEVSPATATNNKASRMNLVR